MAIAWMQQLELLRASLAALGPRRLAALGVVGGGVIAVVAATGYVASRADLEPLYVGLGPSDVTRIGSALRESGIGFDISADGSKVLVRRARAPEARMLLAEKGLPAGATAGYELFDRLGPLGLTSFMQEVTRVRALEGELARTLQTIRGVKSARVHVVPPDVGSLRRARQPASASVVLRLEGQRDPAVAQLVRHLVAAAVPGLAADSVSVASTDGAILAAVGDAGGAAASRALEVERQVARQIEDNVRRTLAPYVGSGNLEVSVVARLNMDKRQVSEQIFDPESKSERSARVVREQASAQNAGARPATSAQENVPGGESGPGAGDQSRKSNERREELTNFEISSKTVATQSDGHRVEALSVSVVINRRRLTQLAGASDPAAVDRRIKEVEAIAAAAAGVDAKRGDRVAVAAVDFVEQDGGATGGLSLLDHLMRHLDTLLMVGGLVAVSLVVVLLGLKPAVTAIVRGRAPELVAAGVATAAAGALPAPGSDGAGAEAGPAHAGVDGQRLSPVQSRLAGLVEQDERQVASLLRQWLAEEA
jgi:flagellar M-ring protein FliF